jgi:AcrR family transcriptional regulator
MTRNASDAPTTPARSSKREAILHEAAKLFAKHGYADTDVQVVADRAKVGKGTVYRYFDDKKGLFLSVSEMVWRELHQCILERLADGRSAMDKIRLGVRANFEFFQRHPHYIEIAMIERATFHDTIEATQYSYRKSNIDGLHRVLEEAVRKGSLRRIDVRAVADLLCNLTYGTIVAHALTGRHRELVRQTNLIMDMFLHGFGA